MTSSRPVFAVPDWAPAQEAIYEETMQPAPNTTTSTITRNRSMSIPMPWRRRKSSLFHMEDNMKQFKEMSLNTDNEPSQSQGEPTQHSLKGLFRRASVSVKAGVRGAIHRRTSVPSIQNRTDGGPDLASYRRPFGSFAQDSHHRPTTSQSTWHRLRQAASFHRPSRFLHSGHDERNFTVEPIDSPLFPVPGSGEQPPIVPRNTGAAARQAAASSHVAVYELEDSSVPIPKPNWLAPDEGGLKDYESGVGISVTSSHMEAYIPLDDFDSDVDIDVDGAHDVTDISKLDFVTQLPTELAIQILAYLDASTLAIACRVSRHWNHVVANQHVWRESFLREKTTTYATSGPVKPGTGMGVPALGTRSDWRGIYRVKEELDKRWSEGKARPVYLNGHSDSIYCLQFDESKIVTGSRDKTIRVWDMKTYTCKLIIGPPEKIRDPDNSLLYDANNMPIHYATLPETDSSPPYNTEPAAVPRAHESTPALVSYPMHHDASILCLQYDDEILVTGSSDSTCIVYDIKAGYRPIRRLQHHTAAVLDLVFDDKHIVTCSKDVSICVWDRETGALLKQLRGHSGPVNAVQMRGNTIVSCSGDFRVKLWNIDTGKNIREFTGHTKGLACTQFSEDGRYVASAGNDKVIRIWDANTGECVREMRAHDNLVRSLHVDSVSGRLISGSYDTDIKVFDMETGRQLLDFPRWHNSWVLSAKSDYRRIVSTGQDPKILIMDFGAGIKGIDMLESTTGRVDE